MARRGSEKNGEKRDEEEKQVEEWWRREKRPWGWGKRQRKVGYPKGSKRVNNYLDGLSATAYSTTSKLPSIPLGNAAYGNQS